MFSHHETAAAVAEPATGAPGALGVGVLYHASLAAALRDHLELVDYVEVVPEMFWIDRGPGRRPRFVEVPSDMAALEWLAVRRPLVLHGAGLSLGSAGIDDVEYREHLVAWSGRMAARWVSDHLSFTRVGGAGGAVRQAGLALPVARDAESLAVVAGRVRAVSEGLEHLGIPFLVENVAAHVDLGGAEMSEAEFLGALADRSGCGLLLDLPNLCANARLTGHDVRALVDELDLGPVMEIHVAGGSPSVVWELLERVAPAAPRLCGVTFELHESGSPGLGARGLRAELEHARALWPWDRGA